MPPNKKHPIPEGWTGGAGNWVDAGQVTRWVNAGSGSFTARSNIALRLPKTVLGIDADMYDGKAGRATLAWCESRWGDLPPTWVSTSRSDGSGIRLFRIPEGLAWPDRLRGEDGSAASGVELVRWDHRYCIVMPSMNPDTRQRYAWIKPDGSVTDEEFPAPEDLPELPVAWVEGLTNGASYSERARADLTDGEAKAWLEARPGAKAAQCETMRRTSEKYVAALNKAREDGGAHDEGRNGVWAVAKDAKAGHKGILKALKSLREAFFSAVEGRRDKGAAESEWRRIVVEGVRKVCADDHPERTTDDCEMMATAAVALEAGSTAGEVEGDKDAGLGPTRLSKDQLLSSPFNDSGNAKRFLVSLGGDVRHVPGEGRSGTWYLYDGTTWRPDNSQIHIWAQQVADNAADVARGWLSEDPADNAAKSAVKWFHTSSMSPGLAKMKSEAAPHVELSVNDFDRDPNLLVCPNGTLELKPVGVEFRGNRRSDYAKLCTGVAYDPTARHGVWDKFLDTFVPDLELRAYLQLVAGYSLTAKPEDRAMFIVIGPTSSGKSTFMEAMLSSLGDYASIFNLSMLRDSQEERSRPDLVAALPKRMLFASEASAEWHLHADHIKRLTGGDRISARKPFGSEYLTMRPAFTAWMVTNEPPSVEGADLALWQRLIALPFPVSLPGERFPVSELHTPAAREAVLAWVVEGWKAYREAGTIRDLPTAAVDATHALRGSLSELDFWLNGCCEFDAGYCVRPDDLFSSYRLWAEEYGTRGRELSFVKFGKAIKGRGFERKQKRIDGQPEWHYMGLKLKASIRQK